MLQKPWHQATESSDKAMARIKWRQRSFQISLLTAFACLGILVALVFWPNTTLLERLRWLDSGICAQLLTHSFYPGGERLPLCARNTGIYLGFIITLFTLCAVGRGRVQQLPSRTITLLLLTGGLAMVGDGFNSFLFDLGLPHLYHPENLLRLATGLIAGLAMAVLTLPTMNDLFWRQFHPGHSVPSWSALLLLTPGMLLGFFAVASQSALFLYPVALLSTASLLIVVGSINVIGMLTIWKREQTFERYRELLPFFGMALLFAVGELLALAQLKLALLHTLHL